MNQKATDIRNGLNMFVTCDQCEVDAEHDVIYVVGPTLEDFNQEGLALLERWRWYWSDSNKWWYINV